MIELEVKARVEHLDKVIDILNNKFKVLVDRRSTQLNHFFIVDVTSINKIFKVLNINIQLRDVEHISVRTRFDSAKGVLLIVKYSKNKNVINGIIRQEIEEPVSHLTLDELDELILSYDGLIESKWSRERVEYSGKLNKTLKDKSNLPNVNIFLDKNSGFGTILEVETILNDDEDVDDKLISCRNMLKELELTELPLDYQDKMYSFYCGHWKEFYNTEKTIFEDIRFYEYE
jgi:adenylate cyclase class IV